MRYQRRLNIKCVILFPIIVYDVYIFIDSSIPLFMVGLVIWLLHNYWQKKVLVMFWH